MFLRERVGRLLAVLLLIGLSAIWLPEAANATHYPDGYYCQDCHATTASKMVIGTHMIKADAFTATIQTPTYGWAPGSAVPCLFCHRSRPLNASADATMMKSVENHFTSAVASKHDSNYASSTADAPTDFGCLSCHTSYAGSYVADDLAGNATVHGVDASQKYIDGSDRSGGAVAQEAALIKSLVGYQVGNTRDDLQTTCAAVTCHGGATDNTIDGRTAKKAHPMSAGYTDCTNCHASHRGEKQGSLVVLLKDGSKDPQDGTVIPDTNYVKPENCGNCHEAYLTAFTTVSKHGNGTGTSTLTCTSCHSKDIPHTFATGGSTSTPTSTLRYGLSITNPSQSSVLRNYGAYKPAYSICVSTCHEKYRPTAGSTLHGQGTNFVGCADCHEPHGLGVGSNDRMIRQVMPKLNPTTGAPAPVGASYETVNWVAGNNGYMPDATGLCDNAECHTGVKSAVNPLVDVYPLASFFAASTANHTGGTIDGNTQCDTCHNHTDQAGSWAAQSSCDGCHGNPPTTGAHLKHKNAGFNCDKCHPTPGAGVTHRELSSIQNSTDFANTYNSTPTTIRNSVDLVPGLYNLAEGSRNSMSTYGDCATTCHGGGLAAADQGTDTVPTWNTPASGACGTCHKDQAGYAAGGASVHKKHAADRAIACQTCHFDSFDGTSLKYPAHVNAVKDVVLKSGSTFNGASVSLTYNSGSCSNASCHGGWTQPNLAWNAGASCTNCHAYPPASAGVTNHDATAPADVTIAQLKTAHSNCTTCHGVSASNETTPNAFGTPADFTASFGDAYVIATNHIDGKVQMNGISGTNDNMSAEYDTVGKGCNKACHDNTYKITTVRAGNVVDLKELGKGGCDGCHGGTGEYWPNANIGGADTGTENDAGRHIAHMTVLAQRVYGLTLAGLKADAATDTKQKALCEYCHAAVTNRTGHSTSGDAAEVFATTVGGSATRRANNMAGANTDADAAYVPATGACNAVDCHNNKATTATYYWYATGTSACTMCHSVGGTNNPTTGLHNAARISANLHDDAFKITPTAPTDAGSCTTCHTMPTMASQTSVHDNATFNSGVVANLGLATAGLFYAQTVPGQGTCTLSGGLAGCHSDGGVWQRVWNSTAANSDGAECANCHGGLTTGYVAGAFSTGVTQRHSDPQIPGNHATCDYCHEYNNGSTTPYNLGTMHRDGNIQLNATVVADLGYTESGTAPNKRIGCSNCHSATDDAGATYADGKHEFNMVTDGTRWTRANLDGAAYDCTSCHTANAATHVGTGESATVHSTHTNSTSWIANCQDCHSNNGPGTGTGHADGTVSFGGTRMTTAFNYTLASNNFTTATNCATAANGCHDAAATTWTAPATITCDNCHNAGTAGTVDAGKIMDMGTPAAAPTTGSHAKHRTTTTGAGATCNDCHGTNATLGTHTGHQNNLVTLSGASAGYTGSLDPRNTSNGGTCGVNMCHNNGQNAAAATPAYAWGTAIGTGDSCTECHDATTTLATQSHSAHNNAAAAFGQAITCNSCHAAATAATHGNGTVNFGGTVTFTYAGDVAVTANGGTFGGCGANTCHNAGYSSAAGTLATPKTSAYTWGTAIANCDACHQDAVASMATGSHTNHLTTTTGAGALCTDCHSAATSANHINGTVNMGGTIITADTTYTGTKAVTEFPNGYGTCGVNSCHNNGKNAAALVPAYTWNTAIGAINSCTECHDATATLATQSHGAHLTAAAAFGQTITCNSCHSAATVATHGNGTINLTGTTTFTYAGDVAVSGTTYGGCGANACHNAGYSTAVGTYASPKTSAYAWGTAIANCDACHQDAVASMATGSHTNHLTTTTGLGAACTDCHSAATNANHVNGTVNMGGTIITLDATYTGTKAVTEFPNGYGSCGVNTCHNNGQNAAALVPAYTWNTAIGAINSCTECHDATATLATQGHNKHLNASATFGINTVACGSCHTAATVATHGNGTVNFGGTVTFTYGVAADATVGTSGGTFASCGTNTCHNDGTGTGAPVVTSYAWNTVQADCTICHQDTTAMVTNAHNEHMNAGYANAACIECHTPATATTHINNSINLDASKVTASGATAGVAPIGTVNSTCTTVNCHNRFAGAGSSAAWNIPTGIDSPGTNDLACNACHYYNATPTAVNYTAYTGGAMSASHSDHFTAQKLCTDCHAAVTNTTHISVKTGASGLQNGSQAALDEAAVARASMTYSAGVADAAGANNTCTGGIALGCHATGTPDWDVAFATTACTNCHTDKTTAAVNPTSGLHSVVPLVTGEQHDESFAAGAKGCADCHNITTAVTTHANGTLNGDGSVAGDRTAMMFQNFTYANISNNNGTCTATAAGCHDTTRNTWAHKWNSTAGFYTTNTTECEGCHGDSTGFNAGVDHVTTAQGNGHIFTQHGGTTTYFCKDCHNLEASTGYTFTYSTNDWKPNAGETTSTHGDGQIQVNSNGTNYDTPQAGYCNACHPSTPAPAFVDTTWTIASVAGDAVAGCNGCHGNSGTGQNWPDGTGGTPAYVDNQAGAHTTHINAIGSVRGWTTVSQKNQTCDYCHPNPGGSRAGAAEASHQVDGGTPASTVDVFQDGRVAGETQYFKTLAGANDGDLATATYNPTTKVCSNIDCHGDITTPAWLDLVGPVFSPNNTITVTNPASDGDLSISWNAATDALSSPVSYDLYRHTAAGDACTLGTTIATGLGALGYIDSGRTNGTTYYYCVKAKDAAANTTSSTTASAAPTAPAPVNTTYYLTRRTTGTIYGATSFNSTTCGTAGTAAAATTTPATIPYVMRGGLDTAVQCGTASTNNYVSNSSPANGAGTSFENMIAFYTPAFASATTVTGAATGSSLYMRGSGGTEDVRLWLAAMATDGTLTTSASSANLANIGTTATTAKVPNLSALSVNVPAGGRLALLYTWSDVDTTASTNDRLLFDNYSATEQSRIVVSMPATDSTAPTYTATSLVATDAGTGGSVNLTWTAATDTSTPLHYDVYASTSNVPATLFATPVQSGISTNSTTVTGLVDGTTYYFGVRASDAFNNTETNTFVSAGVAPTASTGGAACDTCHGMPPATGAHLVHSTSSVNDCNKCHGNTTYMPSSAYTNGYTPSIHGDGTKNMWFQRKADGSASGDTDAAWGGTTCTNVNCHMNITTPNWVGGSSNCGSCHGYPPTAASGTVDHDANLTVAPATLANFLSSHTDCETCHGAKSSDGTVNGTFTANANYPAGSHGDGLIRMNGPDSTPGPAAGTEYDDAGGCNKACHANNATYQMAVSPNFGVNYGDFGAGDCNGCHKAGGSGSFVTSASSHVIRGSAVGYNAFNACTDCHPGNLKGSMHSKNADANVAVVANNTTVGINYTHVVDGTTTGFVLGGDATTGTTEAEICWNCHNNATYQGAALISEFGTNTNVATGSLAYNYGTLNTPNWTTATWTSGQTNAAGNFSYKTGPITSTHSVNAAGTSQVTATANTSGFIFGSAPPDNTVKKETVDTVANIRCSYCHDVHGTHDSTEPVANQGQQPFLRGTWKGNPYPEDGAPRSGWTNWSTNDKYGAVPRASASSTNTGVTAVPKLGGFWIDQNSGNPNSGKDTLAGANETSGLCALCHGGTTSGTWTAATQLDSLDQRTGEGFWVGEAAGGVNGHQNVVLGSSGTTNALNNIFSRSKRSGGLLMTRSAFNTTDKYNIDPGASSWSASASQEGGYSYRGSDSLNLAPAVSRPYGWESFAWNTTLNAGSPLAAAAIAAGTAELQISNFTLGSLGTTTIHTEAASFNAQSKYHTFNCGKCHNPHASRLPKLMITNCLDTNHNTWDDGMGKATTATAPFANSRDSQWPSAQNCHRLDDRGALNTGSSLQRGSGWNRVTPWAETATPDP